MRMRRKVFALGLTLLMAACVPQASVGPPAGATALPTADVVAVATDQTADPSPTAGATAPATSTAPASEPPEIGPVEGFNDGIVLATADAALVVVYPGTGQVVTLVGPGNYAVDGDNHLIPFLWPVRFSPDGQWAIVPTPAGGTWLAGMNGESRQIHAQRLTATWSPDGRRIAFVGQRGQFEANTDGNVWVQDVFSEAAAEPLARLPGRVWNALWSPGCDQPSPSCVESIAVDSQGGETLTLRVLDPETGEGRELGRFRPPPIDGSLWFGWSSDGSALIARADATDVVYPLDGSGPKPLVVPDAGPGQFTGEHSPDGTLYARLERRVKSGSTLIIGRTDTGEEVAFDAPWRQVESFHWSADGRYILTSNYECRVREACYQVWAIDVASFPELGEPVLLGEAKAFLGTVAGLTARSTEVDPRPWAELSPLPDAGAAGSWARHEWPEAGMAFHAPGEWKVETGPNQVVVADFTTLSPGIAALEADRHHVSMTWYAPPGFTPDYSDIELAEDRWFNWDVEPIEVHGVAAVILRDPVTPVCAHLKMPRGEGELSIDFCPAPDFASGWAADFLAGLEW